MKNQLDRCLTEKEKQEEMIERLIRVNKCLKATVKRLGGNPSICDMPPKETENEDSGHNE